MAAPVVKLGLGWDVIGDGDDLIHGDIITGAKV